MCMLPVAMAGSSSAGFAITLCSSVFVDDAVMSSIWRHNPATAASLNVVHGLIPLLRPVLDDGERQD